MHIGLPRRICRRQRLERKNAYFTSAQAYALISRPTAISMITGVFHFMAVSLSRRGNRHHVRFEAECCQLLRRVQRNGAVIKKPPLRRRRLKLIARFLAASALLVGWAGAPDAAQTEPRFAVLVFSKTSAFRHDSIPDGIAAIRGLGKAHGFAVDSTEDAARFTDTELGRYKVVMFLNTTGDILDDPQKAAFERYIRAGGGFVGIHSATDTEYGWAWYGRLVGAYFASHPQIQPAVVHIEDPGHASTEGLPALWERTDEWYNFRSNPRDHVHVLARLDETSYSGGKMGADHPIAWCQEIDGGRSWYTAMGHTKETYAEPLYRQHLLGGIESAAGIAGGCGAEAK
jgi:type 1 glutamine amidotransferase